VDISCPTTASVPLSGGLKWDGTQSQVHIANSGPVNSSGGVSTIPDAVWRFGTNNDSGAAKALTAFVVCTPA
jgi:hypothetical protein